MIRARDRVGLLEAVVVLSKKWTDLTEVQNWGEIRCGRMWRKQEYLTDFWLGQMAKTGDTGGEAIWGWSDDKFSMNFMVSHSNNTYYFESS